MTLAPQATIAARDATQTIPIVFVAIGDPVTSGLVPSLSHPGANMTGTTRMLAEMSAKTCRTSQRSRSISLDTCLALEPYQQLT